MFTRAGSCETLRNVRVNIYRVEKTEVRRTRRCCNVGGGDHSMCLVERLSRGSRHVTPTDGLVNGVATPLPIRCCRC